MIHVHVAVRVNLKNVVGDRIPSEDKKVLLGFLWWSDFSRLMRELMHVHNTA